LYEKTVFKSDNEVTYLLKNINVMYIVFSEICGMGCGFCGVPT